MEELSNRLKWFGTIIIGILIDCLFLTMWSAFQWILNEKILPIFKPTGIEVNLLLTFQVIFAIATLYPVVAYIAKDLYSITIRTKKEIEKVKRKNDVEL